MTSLKIDDEAGRMELDIKGEKIVAYRDASDRWTVSNRLGRTFTRGQAITALTITEHRAQGAGDDDPAIRGWEDELRDGEPAPATYEPDPHDRYDS